MKKIISVFLALSIFIGSFCLFENPSYAATSCIKKLKSQTNYYYDLDGNGKKEKIRFVRSKIGYNEYGDLNYNIKLYINGKYVTSLKGERSKNSNYSSDDVSIFDFYSKDKSKEIYLEGCSDSKIVKYNKGKYVIKNITNTMGLASYNKNTGIVEIHRCASAILGGECSEYKVSGYTITKQPIDYGINADLRTVRYKALKDIKAYKEPNSSKVAFTIKKGNIVYIWATYSKGTSKYIKIRTSSDKYGWVKVKSLSKVPTDMFKNIGFEGVNS